jgi:hypothetical protein
MLNTIKETTVVLNCFKGWESGDKTSNFRNIGTLQSCKIPLSDLLTLKFVTIVTLLRELVYFLKGNIDNETELN